MFNTEKRVATTRKRRSGRKRKIPTHKANKISSSQLSHSEVKRDQINSTHLQNIGKVRDLGFFTNESLRLIVTFCNTNICSKLRKGLHWLKIEKICTAAYFKIYIPIKALKTKDNLAHIHATKPITAPFLEYGTNICFLIKKCLIRIIEDVQNSFTRKLLVRSAGYGEAKISDNLPPL